MAKGTRRNTNNKTTTRKTNETQGDSFDVSVINKILPNKHRLKCKNSKQKDFANLITAKEIVIAAGPAGVGKSYVAIARALELLQNKTNSYDKIVISTPAIEAGEKHGFLPGDMKEKMEPHVASSIDILDKIMGKSNRIKLQEQEIVIVEPLAFIRGKTIDNSILVMEEVQNMSPEQVKTLLTRIGSSTKFILSGDLDQSDRYRNVKDSGLYDVMHRHRNIPEIGFFEFDVEDIVRNPIITKILKNYNTVSNDVKPKFKSPGVCIHANIPSECLACKTTKPKVKKNEISFIRKLKIFFKRKFKF
jgi:phosphate starvation-inducible PhoH-like protein